MSDVAMVSAVYDSYDELKPALPQAGVEVDWVFVTDDPVLGAKSSHLGWRVAYEPRPGVHPNRAAKHPKYEPWKYSTAPVSLWVDASFRIVSDRFAVEATAGLTDEEPIAQFQHPWRDCLFAEAKESAGLAKYAGEPVLKQAESYRAAGHPESWGLWATGVIARRHTEAVRKMGWLWLAETYRWSFQDQISQPFALREKGLRPQAFPGNHLATPWLAYEGSGRH
ncbi:glycosyltransferase domain-containing protein [Streptomyces lacrimifluminis]|uniref:glycosyltransferase domain-containing protein n=1 Tax=Streptomyces lacrimifluminis TaxID=1500077 RepID=UPI0031EA3F83